MAVTPSVSVIIPTYNSRSSLPLALEALRGQTLAADEIEVIVVDDGSTDDTWPYVKELADQWPQLTPLQQAHSGTPSVGRNLGLRQAHGRHVFFHDSDDWMTADALRKLVAAGDRLHSDVVGARSPSFPIECRLCSAPADAVDLPRHLAQSSWMDT